MVLPLLLGINYASIGNSIKSKHRKTKPLIIRKVREKYIDSFGRIIPTRAVAMNIGTGK